MAVHVKAWMGSLESSLSQYPYSQIRMQEEYGIALLSRIPFEHVDIKIIGKAGLPSIIARFTINGQRLTLIGAHTLSPTSPTRAENRDQQLVALAQFVSEQEDSIILIGDLNITPWSPFFTDFLRNSGLRDSREGFGLQPTWPTWFPPAWIPIDHALVSSNVVVHHRSIGPAIGSDHYPVIIDFSITAKGKELGIINRRSTPIFAG